jgi:hypothetical protein
MWRPSAICIKSLLYFTILGGPGAKVIT